MAKIQLSIIAALCGAASVFIAPGPGALAQDFRTRLEVEIGKFAGTWYELARTPNEFEDAVRKKGRRYSPCYNVRTEFSFRNPRKLRIRNFCTRQSREGTVTRDVIGGMAIIVGGSGDRKLKVAFGSAMSRMLQRLITGGGRNYWIYCLGPVNENGRYDWAVTGGPNRRFVFLLTRDKTVSQRTKSEMLSCARREGIPVNRLMYRQR